TPRLEYQGRAIPLNRRKALALAAYLACAKQPQSRDSIAALLWPDLDQARARAALRSTLPALTSPVPVSWLEVDRSTLAVKHEAIWIDVEAFRGLLARSRSHPHDAETVCSECVAILHQAIDLYQADFMAGFGLIDSVDYDDWQLRQREWLSRELSGCLRRMSNYSSAQGQIAAAIDLAQRWLALDPLHEAAHRQLMRLYAANGQRTEALRQYQHCVERLESDLATRPEDETTALYAAIQANAAGALPPETLATATSGLLPALPALVIGREDDLTEIKRRLGVGGGQPHSLTVIQGWPGVGKSTLAAALAHAPEVADQFPDGVLWASLGETPSVLSELLTWAEALHIDDPGHTRPIEEITTQLTAALRDKRVLLILDDVWQVEHALPFRVGGQACCLIMTSRLNDVAQALAPTAQDVYRLSVLSEDRSLELLSKLTPETVGDFPNEARELVRDLEGLPLAVQVAGRLLHTEAQLGWGIRDLLAELRDGARLLRAQPPSEVAVVGRDTSPTIAALLKRSTAALDVETRQQFALLGLFVPKPATFDLAAMAAAWDVSDPRPAVRQLVNRGLLEPISGGRFQLHALLVLHARSLLEEIERS
ncbi:MAG TPA: NB-ARC domain-containing protein, partial [Anaerolineae bacterium]|nr:NB-ARC domain-containing protein [Anaerolineae bacterium]